jgi:hypothetical protein
MADWIVMAAASTTGRPLARLGRAARRAADELTARFRHRGDDLACRQAVELVTDYLEGALAPAELARFERHLRTCGPCVRYVEQVRRTADVLGHVHPSPPRGETREALVEAFRSLRND